MTAARQKKRGASRKKQTCEIQIGNLPRCILHTKTGSNMKEYAIVLRANNHVVGRCLSYKKAADALHCVIDSPHERTKYTIIQTINQRPANENRRGN